MARLGVAGATLRLSALLTIALAGSCRSKVPPPPPPPPPDSQAWLITPTSIGPLHLDKEKRLRDAKRSMPDANFEVKSGLPWEVDAGYDSVVVASIGAEELFRTPCFCEMDRQGRWSLLPIWQEHFGDIDGVPLTPTTTNPRYRTERGIGVGATVRDLATAYREYGLPYVVGTSHSSNAPPIYEYACFVGDLRQGARPGTAEYIRFYLKPAPGKPSAGRYAFEVDQETPQRNVDPDAKVVAIQTNVHCNPMSPGGD